MPGKFRFKFCIECPAELEPDEERRCLKCQIKFEKTLKQAKSKEENEQKE